MVKLIPTVRKTLRLSREKTIINAWQLLQTAIGLFEQDQYPIACFLAMTAIEEVGKLFILLMAQGFKELDIQVEPPADLNERQLDKFLRNHLDKAVEAAAQSLFINAGAVRRHGVHPASGMHRIDGVVLLARSGRWMDIRNGCLYTDVNLVSKSTSSPSDFITREHAYYFICMGFEVLAERAESGFCSTPLDHDMSKGIKFWQDRLRDLKIFMERWSSTVNLNQLDFLANPDPLRQEAEKREVKKTTKKRKFIQRSGT